MPCLPMGLKEEDSILKGRGFKFEGRGFSFEGGGCKSADVGDFNRPITLLFFRCFWLYILASL